MKKFLSLTLIVVFSVVFLGASVFAKYQDGEYIGVVEDAKYGHTVVAVGIAKGYITNVEIINQLKHQYHYEQGIKAFYAYPAQVITEQAGNIDALSGATGSYQSYNTAVQMALDTASGVYQANKYYGLSRDYRHGHIVVEVTLNSTRDKIENVRFITANADKKMANYEALMTDKSKGYPYPAGVEAFVSFPEKVKKAQNVAVDGVAGATHSNHGFSTALSNALNAAGVLKNFE